MSLIDEVKECSSESHKKWFDRFFDDLKIEEKIKQSAMKGYSGYKISSPKNDEYLARRLDSQKTVDLLKQRLGDGFKVEIKTLESPYKLLGKPVVFSRDLCIFWMIGDEDGQ
ncbi:hypothetical protein ABNG39_11480 [Streptococcus dysgalactiae]|uniref:hypothetical protein n=1 Tax=Streptococcus dysgalactiae TaxID=1334 RepID=UPI00232CA3F3|nr:hypothetical protein [Streptococcus dysgalactiae]WCE85975.1 hypothetical protein PMN45_11790 [Streptococcus dysgalactiae]WCN25971.1 hypothetical protein PP188_11790 [Streptococcus dysgalactiae]